MGESARIKEINFEQSNLIDFKFCTTNNLFFLLSGEPAISIWDYDKLVILNQIELGKLGGQLVRNIVLDSVTNTLLLHGEEKVILFQYESNGRIKKLDVLEFSLNLHESRTVIVAASLLREKVSCSVVDEMKNRKMKRNHLDEGKKEVDFIMIDQEPTSYEDLVNAETLVNIPILAILNNLG